MKNLLCFMLLVSCLNFDVSAKKPEKDGGKTKGLADTPLADKAEKKDKISCFEKPNEELKQKLKECIKESKKEMRKIMPAEQADKISYKVPPRIFMVKRCYFMKLGLVSEDFQEFYVDKVEDTLQMFDLPEEERDKIIECVQECKDANEEMEKPIVLTEEQFNAIFPEGCRKASGTMNCIKRKLQEFCSEFHGLPVGDKKVTGDLKGNKGNNGEKKGHEDEKKGGQGGGFGNVGGGGGALGKR